MCKKQEEVTKNQEIKYSIEADEEINQISLLVGKDFKITMTEICKWINKSEQNECNQISILKLLE